MIANRTDMAVLKPFRIGERAPWRFSVWHGVALVAALIVAVGIGEAQAAPGTPGIMATILKWTPLLLQGFALNIAMSFLAMAIGTAVGVPLGLAQISLLPPVRGSSWFVTQFFRFAESRVEMLTNYRKQLLELQAKATTNIDAAIKIASELSTVQSNLEKASGEAAFQVKRTTTDVVTVRFSVTEQKAFWRPIREALRDFFGNLSNGVSQAITAVAYILPWLLVVIPGLYLVRFLWKRRGRGVRRRGLFGTDRWYGSGRGPVREINRDRILTNSDWQ